MTDQNGRTFATRQLVPLSVHLNAPNPTPTRPYPHPCSMTDQNGREFTVQQLAGKWALIDFGSLGSAVDVKSINSICRCGCGGGWLLGWWGWWAVWVWVWRWVNGLRRGCQVYL